jgi:hypothetical protein
MLDDHQNGNEVSVKQNAESIMNLLVGNENPQSQKDWNGDGQVTDPGDGYGFLLNGDNLGYIQAVYSHADYAINSSGATRNMIVNGENVKVCTQNLARWVPELRDHMSTILSASTLTGMDTIIQRSADLADQMLNGIDLDENGEIDPVADECGILAAYDYAHMADMPLLPVTVNSLVRQMRSVKQSHPRSLLHLRRSISPPQPANITKASPTNWHLVMSNRQLINLLRGK